MEERHKGTSTPTDSIMEDILFTFCGVLLQDVWEEKQDYKDAPAAKSVKFSTLFHIVYMKQ